eukprot:5166002-Amphidinium_carterae.1
MHPGWVQPAQTWQVTMQADPNYKKSDLDLEWRSDPACGDGCFSGPVVRNRIFAMLEASTHSICGGVTIMNDPPSTT